MPNVLGVYLTIKQRLPQPQILTLPREGATTPPPQSEVRAPENSIKDYYKPM